MLQQAYPLPTLASSEVVVSEDGTGWAVTEDGGVCEHEGPGGEVVCDCPVHDFTCPCGTCDILHDMNGGRPVVVEPWTCPGKGCEGCQSCPDNNEWGDGDVVTGDVEAVEAYLARQADIASAEKTAKVDKLLRDAGLQPDNWGEVEAMFALIWTPAKRFEAYTRPLIPREEGVQYPALVSRIDGATVLYANVLNTIYGLPAACKSFVGLMMAKDAMTNKGCAVLWWDFEDRPSLLADRARALGCLDMVQDKTKFLYLVPALGDDPEALQAAKDWAGAHETCLLVLDSAEAAGAASDGSDVMPWYRKNIMPWVAEDVRCSVLVIDHVPKSKDRARGAIGSQRKVAQAEGVSLLLKGIPFTRKTNGRLTLVVDKDRRGDTLTKQDSAVTTLVVLHKDVDGKDILTYSWELPDAEGEGEDLAAQLLEAITAEGPAGVKGSRGVRGLVKGPYQEVDRAVAALLKDGRIERELFGKAFYYRATQPPEEPRDEDEETF